MKPGSGRRTRSRDAGRGAVRDHRHRTISGRARPTSLAPSARPRERGRASSCHSATPPPWLLHLAEISRTVAPGAHAVLLLDQAGWHLSAKLDVPDNITLMPLPPKSPELNPVENIWQFIRDNWLSN